MYNNTTKVSVNPKTNVTSKPSKQFFSSFWFTVIFGYACYINHQNIKSRLIKFLLKSYCLFVSISMSVLLLIVYNNRLCGVPTFLHIIEYLGFIFIFMLPNNLHYEKFLYDICFIDIRLDIDFLTKIKSINYTIFSFILVTRALYSVALYNFEQTQTFYTFFISNFILIAVDINHIHRLVVTFVMSYRLTVLGRKVQDLFSTNDEIVPNENGDKAKLNINEYRDIYSRILDSCDGYYGLISPFVRAHAYYNVFFLSNKNVIKCTLQHFLSLVCCFPKVMFMIYSILVHIKAEAPIIPIVAIGLGAVQWGLIPCLPGMILEIAYNEVDKMKKILIQQYYDMKVQPHREGIKEFIEYIERRPYKYYLFRIITVDMSLPIGLLNLCTTYFIVIIQFTHLFE